MKFPNASFILLASGKKGVTMEPTDAALIVPAVLQPHAEIPGSIGALIAVGSAAADNSFHTSASRAQTGAVAGGTTTIAETFTPGLWRLRGTVIMQFTGTSNLGIGQVTVGIRDAIGPNNAAWFSAGLVTGSFLVHTFDYVYSFLAAGFTLAVITPNTAAGDVLNVTLSLIASKLL